jgi:3-hydroxyisobutyrate dehydrogenase
MTPGLIGICGMGRMGAAMAQRLLSVGHPVMVWNRDPARCAPLVAAGASMAATPAEVTAACDTVLSMLFDGPAVAAVYQGPQGLLAADARGRLFIEMSTIGPESSQVTARAVQAAGAEFVECPVGGTVGPARDGKLLGLVGGTPQALDRARPILEQLCRRIEHAGPVGAGARLKLAVNLPLLVYWQALGEAMGLVADLEMTPDQLADLMADTSGSPMAIKFRSGDLAAMLAGRADPAVGFEARGAEKDLREMAVLSASLGLDAPVTRAAHDAFAAALPGQIGGCDAMAIAALNWRKARGQQA